MNNKILRLMIPAGAILAASLIALTGQAAQKHAEQQWTDIACYLSQYFPCVTQIITHTEEADWDYFYISREERLDAITTVLTDNTRFILRRSEENSLVHRFSVAVAPALLLLYPVRLISTHKNEENAMFRISAIVLLLSGAAILLSGCARPAKSISLDDQFVQDASLGFGDRTPIAIVNGKDVPRGALTTAAALIQNEKEISLEQAYQEAFNTLLQNSLLTEEAHRRGLDPSPEELEEQVRLYFEEMSQHPEVVVIFKSQAEKLGLDWQSEEFKKEYSKGIFNGILYERLRKQIEEQVKGDTGLFTAEMQKLLVTLLSKADINILYENLPSGAENIKIPPSRELPWIKNPYPTIQP